MSLTDFLNPPMFPEPDKIYLPLAEFHDGDDGKLKADFDNAVAKLNSKAKDFSSSKSFYTDYLELIGQAETHAAKRHWTEAHEAVWEATFFVNRALESQAADKFRKCIGWYLALWLVVLGLAGWWLKNYDGQAMSGLFLGFYYWRYVLMGALGGITIAIWGLIKHTSDLDFDHHFAVWYWFKPVLGAVMGLIAVIAAQAGLFAIGSQASLQPSPNGKMALYILAFLAGFSERFFIRIIDRVMTTMFSSEKSPSPPTKTKEKERPASGSAT